MRKIIILLFISICFAQVYANSCYQRIFNISVNSKSTLLEILNELGKECGFSIIIKDSLAQNKLNATQNYLHIRKMSL